MGQHKFNQTAIDAKEGRLGSKPRKERLAPYQQRRLYRGWVDKYLRKKGLAPEQLFNPQEVIVDDERGT